MPVDSWDRSQAAAVHHDDGHRVAARIGRRHQIGTDVHRDGWVGTVVDVAGQFLGDHGDAADGVMQGAGDFPCHRRHVVGYETVDLALHQLGDFRASFMLPM
jgi:hypothetical protein